MKTHTHRDTHGVRLDSTKRTQVHIKHTKLSEEGQCKVELELTIDFIKPN